jgi:hypothetical protein
MGGVVMSKLLPWLLFAWTVADITVLMAIMAALLMAP